MKLSKDKVRFILLLIALIFPATKGNVHSETLYSELSSLPNKLSSVLSGFEEDLASVETALESIKVLRNDGKTANAKLERWQNRIKGNLQELSEFLSNETNGIKSEVSIVSNSLKSLESYRNWIEQLQDAVEDVDMGLPHASPRIDISPVQTEVPLTPADCSERPEKISGVYTIYPSGAAVQVYCDQTTDGGGWTVFLRRQKQEPQLNFRQTFSKYEEGFGSRSGEYWLGLKNLHILTSQKQYELRVLVAKGAESASSHYQKFQVGGGSSYKLQVEGYDKERSTAGDSFTYHSGHQFSAIDRDRDSASGGSCSEWSGGGGWWYNYCYMTNPTGLFGGDKPAHEDSDLYLEWRNWQGYYAYLSKLTFMIRPKTL